MSHVSHEIVKHQQGEGSPSFTDSLIEESPLEIWCRSYAQQGDVSTQKLATIMRTPGDDISLVTGWLLSHFLVENFSDIQRIYHTGKPALKGQDSNSVMIDLKVNVVLCHAQTQYLDYVSASCGICAEQQIEYLRDKLPFRTLKSISMSAKDIGPLLTRAFSSQPLFQLTGGSHCAVLFDESANIVDAREDVGRHNALDKLIGANRENMQGQSYGIFLSGRVSFDLVQKAAASNVSMILAVGAPSSLAVALAAEYEICLIGFIKAGGFNVYTMPLFIE